MHKYMHKDFHRISVIGRKFYAYLTVLKKLYIYIYIHMFN